MSRLNNSIKVNLLNLRETTLLVSLFPSFSEESAKKGFPLEEQILLLKVDPVFGTVLVSRQASRKSQNRSPVKMVKERWRYSQTCLKRSLY